MTLADSSYGIEQAPHLGGYVLGGDRDSWAPEAWRRLIEETGATSMIDLGCGEGYAAKWFQDAGLFVQPIDGGHKACNKTRERVGLCYEWDYTEGPLRVMRFDLCWCCEFVEHVEERFVPNFLATMQSCRYVAMTHAPPGQGGHHHVNCRTADYWIGVMAGAGFSYLEPLSLELRALVPAGHGGYVRNSLMVFGPVLP